MLETSALKLLQWLIYVINSVVVLSHQCSTTVSLETYPLYARKNLRGETPKKRQKNRQAKKQVTHPCTTCRQTAIYIKKKKKRIEHICHVSLPQ